LRIPSRDRRECRIDWSRDDPKQSPHKSLAANYLAVTQLASIRLWLRVNESTPQAERVQTRRGGAPGSAIAGTNSLLPCFRFRRKLRDLVLIKVPISVTFVPESRSRDRTPAGHAGWRSESGSRGRRFVTSAPGRLREDVRPALRPVCGHAAGLGQAGGG
jgi:hypothetical protein